jgi:hypothetical protein
MSFRLIHCALKLHFKAVFKAAVEEHDIIPVQGFLKRRLRSIRLV